MKDKRIIFMGTPDFAVPVLEKLIANYQVIMVVTQPDAFVGRKKELVYSPIKKLALNHQIPVFQPLKIRTDYQPITDLQPDIIITCAYGQIIPLAILECAPYGAINVHASLLPKLRGGAPIHQALINGEKETGITIMCMDEKMDEGDMIAQAVYQIQETDDVGILHEKLRQMGADLLIKVLPTIFAGTNKRLKQDHEQATYAYNIKREAEHLDFKQTTKAVYNQIRGLHPWPLANLIIDNQEVKALTCTYEIINHHQQPGIIIKAEPKGLGITTQDGIIYLTKIKPFGKKAMTIKDYLNGLKAENLIGKEVK